MINKKNYVFNEAASKDYVCINQGTKAGLFLIISDHYRLYLGFLVFFSSIKEIFFLVFLDKDMADKTDKNDKSLSFKV